MIVEIDGCHWIVLEITENHYRNKKYFKNNGYPSAGFYAYRGFWYGNNPMSHKSYGKFIFMSFVDSYKTVFDSTFCLKNTYLKTIL